MFNIQNFILEFKQRREINVFERKIHLTFFIQFTAIKQECYCTDANIAIKLA